jgi:hypothetical protein
MDYLKSRLQPDINPFVTKAEGLSAYVDTSSVWLWICLASIVFNPVFWNTVARNGEFLEMGLLWACGMDWRDERSLNV